jgi:hypothetical protein
MVLRPNRPNNFAIARQAGLIAGKILLGENPATFPIERPLKEMVVNLKTARHSG